MATEKEIIIEHIKSLPDDVTLSDIMHSLYVKEKIFQAEAQLDAGKGISHTKIEEEAEEWLQ